MSVPLRQLRTGQVCQVWVHDTVRGQSTLCFETHDLLLEAPNWTLGGDALILNGDGRLWRLPLSKPELQPIAISGVPNLNNDHMLDPDGVHVYLSANDDWQIYRVPVAGGAAARVTGREGPEGLLHFLHGVSPDGGQLAFVGVVADVDGPEMTFRSAEICTIGADGRGFRQLTSGGAPADGPEYGPDGAWLYFNTEAFSGHAQIARMRTDGSEAVRLTDSPSVDWFPHLSPDGRSAVYLSYPPGTRGHPADFEVELKLVRDGNWLAAVPVARLLGGQGTINVSSWSPDATRFAFVAYPIEANPGAIQ